MAAYVVAHIDVTDAKGYEEYKAAAARAVEKFGGKYLARGGRTEVLEGSFQPKRLVLLQFESVEKARAWWNSTEYARAKAIRQRTATSSLVIVDGV